MQVSNRKNIIDYCAKAALSQVYCSTAALISAQCFIVMLHVYLHYYLAGDHFEQVWYFKRYLRLTKNVGVLWQYFADYWFVQMIAYDYESMKVHQSVEYLILFAFVKRKLASQG